MEGFYLIALSFYLKKGKRWRKLSFNPKEYPDADGNIKTTMVCGSMENLVRDLLKGAGLHKGSSHSKCIPVNCYNTSSSIYSLVT